MPATAIDFESTVPLYRQMADDLRRRLREADFAPGSSMPSESTLEHEYGLGHGTVRRVMYLLRDEGYLIARKGARWRVAQPLPVPREPEVVLLPPGADLWFAEATEEERRRHGLPRGASMAYVHHRAVTHAYPVARVRFKVAWRDES